jgi:hypothetical protein
MSQITIVLTIICIIYALVAYTQFGIPFLLFVLHFKFVFYISNIHPLIIIIVFLLLMWSEDLFPGQLMSYTILRRRVGDTKGPWEDVYLFQNTYSTDISEDFTTFTNNFYSSDGFFPHSFNEMVHEVKPSFQERWTTRRDIRHFFNYEAKILVRRAKYSIKNVKVPPLQFTKEWPLAIKHPYTLSVMDDFTNLGPTTTSLSHFDASCYIHDFQEATLFFPRSLKNLRRLRHFKRVLYGSRCSA